MVLFCYFHGKSVSLEELEVEIKLHWMGSMTRIIFTYALVSHTHSERMGRSHLNTNNTNSIVWFWVVVVVVMVMCSNHLNSVSLNLKFK